MAGRAGAGERQEPVKPGQARMEARGRRWLPARRSRASLWHTSGWLDTCSMGLGWFIGILLLRFSGNIAAFRPDFTGKHGGTDALYVSVPSSTAKSAGFENMGQ